MSGMETARLTLADFLLARISEDADAAKDAQGRSNGRWFAASEHNGSGIVDTVADSPASGVVRHLFGPVLDGERQAVHVARHDPAHVLAECEAKRRIVAAHSVAPVEIENEGGAIYSPDCPDCWQSWPCNTLRLLALPYANHPDYRPEWAAQR